MSLHNTNSKTKVKKGSKSRTPRSPYKAFKSSQSEKQRASVDNALIHQRKKKPQTPSKSGTSSRKKHSQSIETRSPRSKPKLPTKPGTPRTAKTTRKPATPKTPRKPRTPRTPSATHKSSKSKKASYKKKTKKHKNGTRTPKSPQSSSLSLSHTHSVRTPKTNKKRATPSLSRSLSNRPPASSTPRKKSNKSKSKSTKSPKPKSKQSKSTANALIDHSKNLSPTNSNKRKKVSNKQQKYSNSKASTKHSKKRSFYSDSYSTKTKGKLQKHYKVKEKIGSGTFSTVRRGIRRSDKLEIAIKIITKTDLNDTEARLIKREIGVMHKLDHVNIVHLYDIFETQHHLYLVIEYCRGGELFDELINCTPSGWFSERETSQIVRQIADALQYMHAKNIIHRDLKLENILIATKKNYAINLRQKKFSMDDDEENEDCNKNKKNLDTRTKRKRGGSSHNVHSKKEDEYDDVSESDSDCNDFMMRRHSEHISKIPSSLLFGVNGNQINDHKQSSIIIKVSDFGLSKKLARKTDLEQDEEDMKSDRNNNKPKTKKKIHILSKRKKKKNNEMDDDQYAVMATNCGTLYYVAPEILNNQPYNEKVDMWSLGVICYVLLCGSLPFYSENELEISDAICACKYDLGESDEHWLKVSDSAKNLIQNLLCLDKVNRLSATKVLNHPFVTAQNALTATKRKSVRWNAGGLLGKWPMKFRNIIDSAKVTFGSESDADTNSESEVTHSKNSKKPKYKINIDSELETENSAIE